MGDWVFLAVWQFFTGWAAIASGYNLRHLADGVKPRRRSLAWALRGRRYEGISAKQVRAGLLVEFVMWLTFFVVGAAWGISFAA